MRLIRCCNRTLRPDVITSCCVISNRNYSENAETAVNQKQYKKYSDIPGPRGLFGIGSFYNYFRIIGKYSWDEMHLSGLEKYKRYGPIVKERLFPGVDILFLFDPSDIAILLNDANSKGYPQRRSHLALAKYRQDRPHIYRSPGLLPTNGTEWWRLRSEFQKGLSSPKHVRSFLPDVDIVTNDFVTNLKVDEVIDIQPELSRLNLELTCLLAFDERMDSFSAIERRASSRSSRLLRATNVSNSCILPTDQSFLWRLFDTPIYRKLQRAQKYIENVAVDFVSQKINYYKDDIDATSNSRRPVRFSILEEYLRNPNLDLSDIVGMAVDLLMAGVDTTTFTSCFAIYHLARNPEIQERLYREACAVLPDPIDPIIPETLNSRIPYTRAVLKESARLNPISIGVGRILNSDTVFSGYLVPEGAVVVTQNMAACRLENNFEDPEKYWPERWLEKRSQINPYLVLPFGHGMRACIARRLAEQSMLVLLLRIIRNYKIEWNGVDELGVKTYLINNPDSPVEITFHRRPFN